MYNFAFFIIFLVFISIVLDNFIYLYVNLIIYSINLQ